MIKDSLIFIKHVLESIRLIESFSKPLTKEKLAKNELRQSAILRELEVVGEAVKNLPEEFTNKYPNVEWKKIAGLRDKLIHHYFGVDLNIVWEVIEKDLPSLKKKLEEILSKEEQKNNNHPSKI